MTSFEAHDDPSCSTCRYWRKLDPYGEGWAADRNYQVEDDSVGICRRLPPVGQRRETPRNGDDAPNSTDAALWAQWPVTDGEGDWCGEHMVAGEGGKRDEA